MADRVVHVSRERLPGWIDGFARRHGSFTGALRSDAVTLTASDGAVAVITVPFLGWSPVGEPVPALLAHVGQDRTVGVVLVRLGGYAVGRFVGDRLVSSKVDSTYVQGRTKAGGWSQQRYARRRGNQAAQAYAETADVVARLLLPHVADLDAVIGGGDAGAVSAVLADSRLAPLRPRLQPRVYPVPDPRLRVLQAFPEQFLAVEISLNELA